MSLKSALNTLIMAEDAVQLNSDWRTCCTAIINALRDVISSFDEKKVQSCGYDKGVTGVTLHFGKYKGKTLSEIVALDPPYLEWMLETDFPMDLLDAVEEALADDE